MGRLGFNAALAIIAGTFHSILTPGFKNSPIREILSREEWERRLPKPPSPFAIKAVSDAEARRARRNAKRLQNWQGV